MSGILHIQDETYRSDRNGNDLELLPGIVSVHPTWDIDRAGSKGQIEVVAESGILEPNMWITTYRTITPERGAIIRYQRGHWRLSSPGIVYDGAVRIETGTPSQLQTANGFDIINDLADAGLTETFYTPVGGLVMNDVRVAAKMATSGIMGPNLLWENGGFELGGSGWTSWFEGSWVGSREYTDVHATGRTPIEGNQYLYLVANPSRPAGAVSFNYCSVGVPQGAQFMYFSGLGRRIGGASSYMAVEFRDSANALISSNVVGYVGTVDQWGRVYRVLPVPASASYANVFVTALYEAAGPAWYEFYLWDDIRVGTCTMMPLPDSRFDLPESTATATTRIQTAYDKSYGYDAINADRLSAIGHFALSTTMTGELTTMPVRTLANTQPRYTFRAGDRRLLAAPVEIPALSGTVYNHFRAIKEDFGDGGTAMIAHAYNTNPNDPHSTVVTGVTRSAPPVHVQDAVDQAALQAIAERERDRQSVRETIRLTTLPLPDLTIYDVIRIDDPSMPHANGLWAMNSIDDTDTGMVLTASRAIGGG